MERVDRLDLIDLSCSCQPFLHNFNTWTETLSNFSYSFFPGKVYSVIGEPGKGGWALSYLLAGKVRNYGGDIFVNSKIGNLQLLKKVGWQVGEGIQEKPLSRFFRQRTIREQLVSCNENGYTEEGLIEAFELSPSRLDRKIKYISNERWNASSAIGLGLGKQVFCFPLFDEMWKETIKVRLKHCSEILIQEGCIVILPTTSLSLIDDFVHDVVYLK